MADDHKAHRAAEYRIEQRLETLEARMAEVRSAQVSYAAVIEELTEAIDRILAILRLGGNT